MEKFETPKVEIIRFEAEDVICSSGGGSSCGNECPELPIDRF